MGGVFCKGPLAIGVDVGNTRLSVALAAADGAILNLLREATPKAQGAPVTLDRLYPLVASCLAESEGDVAGIGIGFGGPVDGTTGTIGRSHHVEGGAGMELDRLFAERFALPGDAGE